MRDLKDVPRWRWNLIYLLDRLDRKRKRFCWANLVMWAMRDEDDDYPTLRECRVGWMCHDGVDRTGSCYCGKITSSVDVQQEDNLVQ